jgi:broad specificity phosphatase PhoE
MGPEVSGLSWTELRERYPEIWAALANRVGPYPVYPGEEGREVFRDRVRRALWSLEERHPDGMVAVVTHAGPIAVFCLDVLGLPYRRPIPLQVDNASLTAVDVRTGKGTILTLNDTCHLRHD